MNTFVACFCDPFKKEPVEYGATEKLDVIRLFKEIPWLQLNEDIFLKQEAVIQDFYFFELSYTDASQEKHTLNISPEYVPGKSVAPEALIFTLRYIRPKMRKRFLGLGGEKLDKTYLTTMESTGSRFVLNCLIAFMDDDKEFLEQQIIPYERSR